MNPDVLRDAADRAADLLDAHKGMWTIEEAVSLLTTDYPDLLAVLGPAARQLADTQDEVQRQVADIEWSGEPVDLDGLHNLAATLAEWSVSQTEDEDRDLVLAACSAVQALTLIAAAAARGEGT